MINFHKSIIVFSTNTPTAQKQMVADLMNIPWSNSLGKYLGCSTLQGRPRVTNFTYLIPRTLNKLEGWKAHCFSKAGRTILIQSHLESLPAHTMQCFTLPHKISSTLDTLARDFFWKNSNPNS